MANRYDITEPVADQLRAVRDDHLMATPDKLDTAYAVMTRAADTLGELLDLAKEAHAVMLMLTDPATIHQTATFDAWSQCVALEKKIRDTHAKALGEGQ